MIFVEECEFFSLISNHISCSLHRELTQDGLDCGDEVGQLISEFLETTEKRNIRLLYYVKGLPTERDYDTSSSFWLNPVPRLHDTVSVCLLFIHIYFFSHHIMTHLLLCFAPIVLLTN